MEVFDYIPIKEESTDGKFSVYKNRKYKTIKDEMKSKVDRESLRSLLSLAGNIRRVSDEVLESYLELWADSKYEFYILFNKNLILDKKMNVAKDEKDFKNDLKEIKSFNAVYTHLMEKIPDSCYMDNVCGADVFDGVVPEYKNGMKLSKFFNSVFKDEDFNIQFSKTIQKAKMSCRFAISIDPIDYMTSAINKHGWRTCQSITEGSFSSGPVALMVDDTTTVVYMSDGKIHDYSEFKPSFKANSKSSRAFVNIDKKTLGFALERCYPNSTSEIAYGGYSKFVQDIISSCSEVDNWNTTVVATRMDGASCHGEYEINGRIRYHKNKKYRYLEGNNNFNFVDPIKSVSAPSGESINKLISGVGSLLCAKCGKKITKFYNDRGLFCSNCE